MDDARATRSGRYDDLVSDLERIVEALTDRAMECLREAVAGHDSEEALNGVGFRRAIVEEKSLNRARRSVEKAAYILRAVQNQEDEATP